MFLCACGYFAVWVSDWCSSTTSQQFLDPYSLTHILHGFLFFWLIALLFRRMNSSWQICLALLLEGAWELFENTRFVIDKYRTETAALGYTGDTIVNSLGDLMCALVGSDTLIGWIKAKLGIGPGETTPDGAFTLSTVECLAACGTGPMMQINDDYYERLTEEKLDRILSDLRSTGSSALKTGPFMWPEPVAAKAETPGR